MPSDTNVDNTLDQAARRLEQALARLEQRFADKIARASQAADGAVDQDRAKLAAELDASRARERELAEAGQQASAALDRAIRELKSALEEPQAAEA